MQTLLATAEAVERFLERYLQSEHGLALHHYKTLQLVASHPDGFHHGGIARSLAVSPGSVTQYTTWLLERGLVTEMRSHADKRVVVVQVTPKGHELALQSKKGVDVLQAAVSAQLDRIRPDLNALFDWISGFGV